MGSEEVYKRKGQTLRLVQSILLIVTSTAFIIHGINFLKRSNGRNIGLELDRESTLQPLSSEDGEPKALPINWSALRTLEIITEYDKPMVVRKHTSSGRREFRFTVSPGDWVGRATTPSHHEKPFSVRIPAEAATAFQRVMSDATMFRAAYAHAPDRAKQVQDREQKVYRPYLTQHENTKYRIRFGFENHSEDLEIVSISHDHCDQEMLPPQCGHFPWVVVFFGTILSPEPIPQWISNSNMIDEAMEKISLYLRG